MKEYYRLLDVEVGAGFDTVRRAYLQLVKVWHPDRFPNDPQLQARANAKLKEVNQAFELLSVYLADVAANKHKPPDSIPRQDSARARQVSSELLTSSTVPQKQNTHYCAVISGPNFAGKVRDVISIKRLQSEEAVGLWPHSAAFRKAVVDIFEKRFVRLLAASEVQDLRGDPVQGTLTVKDRIIVLSASKATNVSPLFLLGVVYVRDFLTMPGYKSYRHFALRALQGFGYQDDGLFYGSSYLEAENSLARELAKLTFDDVAQTTNREGFKGWLRCVACRLGSDSSLKNVLTYLSGHLIFDAPYNSRRDFAQSFR